ncbi:hypothetical protein ACFC0M_03895 [Streptomyces sp. NPDC056149]|uniref:hypothetical protein n=1 Tax=Streptomyces sp. NPDC056149 TaxID=3345728 RepID=UPI0035DEA4AF
MSEKNKRIHPRTGEGRRRLKRPQGRIGHSARHVAPSRPDWNSDPAQAITAIAKAATTALTTANP